MFKKITLKRCGYFFICIMIFSHVLYHFELSSRKANCEGYNPIYNSGSFPIECGYSFTGIELTYILVTFTSMLLLVLVIILIRSLSQDESLRNEKIEQFKNYNRELLEQSFLYANKYGCSNEVDKFHKNFNFEVNASLRNEKKEDTPENKLLKLQELDKDAIARNFASILNFKNLAEKNGE